MAGSINTLKTFPITDHLGAPGLARGMAFKVPSDGNIYMAVINSTFLALNKTTGAVVFAHDAADLQFKTSWDAGSGNFLNSSAGGAPNFTIALFDGTGTLLSNPATGANPYGQIIIGGRYFAGDTGDNFITVLDAATGAPLASIDSTRSNPTAGVGQWAFDGSSIWCTSNNSFIIEIDPVGLTLLNVFNLTAQGIGRINGICFAQGKLYVCDLNNGQIGRVSLTGTVEATFFAFPGPIIFDGTFLWSISGGAIAVYSLDGSGNVTFESVVALANAEQDVAHDPADGPGIVWATSGSGAPFSVQQFQFVPFVPPTGGAVYGTFAGFTQAGQFGGGTK